MSFALISTHFITMATNFISIQKKSEAVVMSEMRCGHWMEKLYESRNELSMIHWMCLLTYMNNKGWVGDIACDMAGEMTELVLVWDDEDEE